MLHGPFAKAVVSHLWLPGVLPVTISLRTASDRTIHSTMQMDSKSTPKVQTGADKCDKPSEPVHSFPLALGMLVLTSSSLFQPISHLYTFLQRSIAQEIQIILNDLPDFGTTMHPSDPRPCGRTRI